MRRNPWERAELPRQTDEQMQNLLFYYLSVIVNIQVILCFLIVWNRVTQETFMSCINCWTEAISNLASVYACVSLILYRFRLVGILLLNLTRVCLQNQASQHIFVYAAAAHRSNLSVTREAEWFSSLDVSTSTETILALISWTCSVNTHSGFHPLWLLLQFCSHDQVWNTSSSFSG